MAHNFSIKLPDFTLLKYLNVAPNVSYGMNWFFRKSEAYFDPETNSVKTEMGKQFGTFGATHNYSGSVSMSTRIYGMFDFGRYHKIQGMTIAPKDNLYYAQYDMEYSVGGNQSTAARSSSTPSRPRCSPSSTSSARWASP